MAKQQGPADPKKPAEQHQAPKGAAAPGSVAHSNSAHAPTAPKGNVGAKAGCQALGCKEKDVRLGFCEEHFRQYKFGLITKTGEKVLDWEKKSEHYQNWLRAQKVA